MGGYKREGEGLKEEEVGSGEGEGEKTDSIY